MRTLFIHYRLFLFFCIAFTSCGKNITVEENSNPQGYADSQVIGSWKITGLTSDKAHDWDGNGTPEKNIYAVLSDCEKDNFYQFTPNKTALFKLSCTSSKPGLWELAVSSFTLKPEGSAAEFHQIISMTSISFESKKTVQLGTEIFTVYTTWSRQ